MNRAAYFFGILLFTSLIFIAPLAMAQGTYYANSCSYADVNDCVTGSGANSCHAGSPTGTQGTHTAVNGDTVNIPAGSCTWNTTLHIPQGIAMSLIGSGTPNNSPSSMGAGTVKTVITCSVSSSYCIALTPNAGPNISRISTLQILAGSLGGNPQAPLYVNGYTCNASSCPHVRIDNLIVGTDWCNVSPSQPADTFAIVWNVFGVADHNTVGSATAGCPNNGVTFANIGHGWWQGIGKYGDNSYAQPDTFGTDKAFYLENNHFLGNALPTDTDYPSPPSGNMGGFAGGGRYVGRFNLIENVTGGGAFSNHGTESTARTRGARQLEVYNNTVKCTTPCNVFGSRSAVWMVFDNILAPNGGNIQNLMTIDDYRAYVNFSPWGGCYGTGGNGPWDANDGATYYSGTYTGGGGSTTFVDSAQTWTATIGGGNSSWANNAANSGNPYSVYNTTQQWGAEIASSSGSNLNFVQLAQCNWGAGTLCTWNSGDTYKIVRAKACLDQPGRGVGLMVKDSVAGNENPVLSTTGAAGPVNQALDPGYEWGDNGTYGGAVVSSAVTSRIINNRDWYQENKNQSAQSSPSSPFTGNPSTGPGTGHGALANRPSSCTAGVAYWATDQGSWNQSASGGQGALYICGAGGWPATPSYTPYTYPHPIISGGGTGTGNNLPNPPSALLAIVQ